MQEANDSKKQQMIEAKEEAFDPDKYADLESNDNLKKIANKNTYLLKTFVFLLKISYNIKN